MRILLCLSVAVLVIPLAETPGQDPTVAEIFTAQCASCHTVPDPGMRTDLAWLDQINRTT